VKKLSFGQRTGASLLKPSFLNVQFNKPAGQQQVRQTDLSTKSQNVGQNILMSFCQR